jgi:hypothetical protein
MHEFDGLDHEIVDLEKTAGGGAVFAYATRAAAW